MTDFVLRKVTTENKFRTGWPGLVALTQARLRFHAKLVKKETDSRVDLACMTLTESNERAECGITRLRVGTRLYAPTSTRITAPATSLTCLTRPSRPTGAGGHSTFRQVVLLHRLPRV
jgi:hypothetical protein